MFDVGFTELLICGVIALVVLGPERLPRLARQLGRFTGQARGYLQRLNAEIDRELNTRDLKAQLDETRRAMDAGIDEVRDELDAQMTDTRKTVRQAVDRVRGRGDGADRD